VALRIDTLELDVLTADPGSPVDGNIWYNSTENRFKIRRNGATQALSDLVELTNHTGSTTNPHSTTLELARQAGDTLAGAINMGGFPINNLGAGVSPTDAATRGFVNDQIDQRLQGLAWQDPVIDRNLYIPPGGPTTGDRYIVGQNSLAIQVVNTGTEVFEVNGDITTELVATDTFTVTGSTGNDGTYTVSSITYNGGTLRTEITVNEDITDATADGNINYASGDWNNQVNNIAEWDGAAWVITVPTEGYALRVLDEDVVLIYDGTGWGPFGSAVDHNSLLNLTVGDPHTQYLPANGSRPMTGNLSMGGNSITNVNLVDGVDVSAHASRHVPSGADPLATAAPVQIGANSTNTEGTNDSFARSDHIHQINTTDGTISSVEAGDGAVEGTGNGVARRDHQHAVSTGGATDDVQPNNVAAEGVSTNLAREDHVHALPTAAPISVTGANNTAGTANNVARSDHQHRLEMSVAEEGVVVGSRPVINFIGATVTAADDAGNDRVNVTITPGADTEKAGEVLNASFAGNPKKATVTFNTAFGDANYAVVLTARTQNNKAFVLTVETKTAAGFVINANANNITDLIAAGWQARPYNDP
jgi:hypothetical protein